MFADYALWIALFPALGWLLISLFSRALGGRGSAWLATGMMALSSVLAVGIFLEAYNAAPVYNSGKLQELYKLEKEVKALEKVEKAAKPAATSSEPAVKPEGEKGEVHSASPELLALEEKVAALENPAPGQVGSLTNTALDNFPFVQEWSWLSIKGEAGMPFGIYYDQLAAITILMVAVVATLIHLFSIGYMSGEDRYPTFFAYINLFAAAMLAMVMSK